MLYMLYVQIPACLKSATKKKEKQKIDRKCVPMIKPHFHIRLNVITLISVKSQGMDDMIENIFVKFF